ncbi:hypothetical protein EG329_002435 [Mollisiaceae sp. DMI_Dod_QoI]|nr:hypothetical protein EG329_002435 [Helotiales sp. DMI_Dod_QoI]
MSQISNSQATAQPSTGQVATISPPSSPPKYPYDMRLKLLDKIHQALQKAEQCQPRDVNEPSPEIFKAAIDLAWEAVHDCCLKSAYKDDPAAIPAFTQLECTLKHVRFSFSRSTPLYVHEDVLRGPYTFEPCRAALESTQDLLLAIKAPPAELLSSEVVSEEVFKLTLKDLEQSHKSAVSDLIKDPLLAYKELHARLESGGPNALFPELSDMVQFLDLHMHREAISEALCNSSVLTKLHNVAVSRLSQVTEEGFPYRKTVNAIENAVAFLDIYARSRADFKAPPLYHSHRYQYYTYFLKAQTPNHVLLPIFHDVGATALLQMRGVPISFVGVQAETQWVDGFWQSPLEFWYHDINHSRRMFQFFSEHAKSVGVSVIELAEMSHHFIKNEVLPVMAIKQTDSDEEKKQKRMAKMIFFEMFHEDAQAAVKSVAEGSLLRAPNTLTPFEHIIDDETRVMYTMEPGATILAYVYRKLAGNFYDRPDNRQEYICIADFRTQEDVASVANTLVAKLGLNVSSKINTAYAYNDEGLPDDFRMEVEKLIDSGLMVPLSTSLKSKS